MEKQAYLTEQGQRIFDQIFQYLKTKQSHETIDTFTLSMLAEEFDKYACAAHAAHQKEGIEGYINKFDNGTVQVNAYHTIMKDCYDKILKHSVRFGLDPESRNRIFKGLTKNKEKKKLTDGLD